MKSEYVQNILNESLDKAHNPDLDIASKTLDRASMNSKSAREFLELLKNKHVRPIPEQKFKSCFMIDGNKTFIFFYFIHIIKFMQNNLLKNIF